MAELLEPVETLPITLLDVAVLAVRAHDGAIYLACRDICQALAIDLNRQLSRLRNHDVLGSGLQRFRVQTAGGPQGQDFLLLEYVPTWLVLINTARVGAAVRERLTWYQRFIIREVYHAFAALTGLPDGPSTGIEDLADLGQIDAAFTALTAQQRALTARQNAAETRQEALEASQQQARLVWRDLARTIQDVQARIAALEHPAPGTISRAQRGHLYQLVQAWGAAQAAHGARVSKSGAYAAAWSALKLRYRIARYEDLPAQQYPDAVAFVRQAYRALTGTDLDLPEQAALPLGDG